MTDAVIVFLFGMFAAGVIIGYWWPSVPQRIADFFKRGTDDR